MNDLFGNPIDERKEPVASPTKPRRNETPRGYAAPPGTGPKHHFCKDCRHSCRMNGYSKGYWKCGLLQRQWTGGFKTDIRLKSPACKHWAPKRQQGKLEMPGPRKFHK